MGRHCFYCGRELKPGESCTCRYSKKMRGEQDTGETTSKTKTETKTDSTSAYQQSKEEYQETQKNKAKNKQDKTKDKSNPFDDFIHSFKKTKAKDADEETIKAKRQDTGDKSESNSFFAIIKHVFTAPSKLIANTKFAGKLNVILTNLTAALLFSFVLTVFIKNSSLSRFIILQDQGLTYDAVRTESISIFVRALLIYGLTALVRVLSSLIILRYINRQKIQFVELWRIFLPGTYYEILVLLIGLLFANNSGLQAIVILLLTVAIRSIIDVYSIKYSVTLSTDKVILETMLVVLITGIIFALTINLVVPNLSNFNVVPSEGYSSEDFTPNV